MLPSLEGYFQISDTMLLTRVLFLIGQGTLLIDGNQQDIWSCHVRLPIGQR
jgi:hypothetical protein